MHFTSFKNLRIIKHYAIVLLVWVFAVGQQSRFTFILTFCFCRRFNAAFGTTFGFTCQRPLIPRLSDWLSNRFDNRLDNQLHRVHKHSTSCPTGCSTSLRTRGVATAGDTGDASPVRLTMSPLHQNDNRQLVFGADFWRVTWRYIIAYNYRPTLLLHVINHYTTCCF